MATWHPFFKRGKDVKLSEISSSPLSGIAAERATKVKDLKLKSVAENLTWSGSTKNSASWTGSTKN